MFVLKKEKRTLKKNSINELKLLNRCKVKLKKQMKPEKN